MSFYRQFLEAERSSFPDERLITDRAPIDSSQQMHSARLRGRRSVANLSLQLPIRTQFAEPEAREPEDVCHLPYFTNRRIASIVAVGLCTAFRLLLGIRVLRLAFDVIVLGSLRIVRSR